MREALEEARRALDDAAMQREQDVQRVGAYWLSKLAEARTEAAAARQEALVRLEAPLARVAVVRSFAGSSRSQSAEKNDVC